MSIDYEGKGPLQLTRFSGGVGLGPAVQITQPYGTGMPCGNGYVSLRMETLELMIEDLQGVLREWEKEFAA